MKRILKSASDIEKSLTVQQEGQQVEEWLELANGCKFTVSSLLDGIIEVV
jgi:hypothetical protein